MSPVAVLFTLLLSSLLTVSEQHCERNYTLDISKGQFDSNTKNFIFQGVVYPPGKFFVNADGSVSGCVCDVTLCVRKCCPEGQSFINFTCQPHSHSVGVDVHQGDQLLIKDASHHSLYDFDYCAGFQLTDDDRFFIQEDGRLLWPDENNRLFELHEFCVSLFDKDSQRLNAHVCDNPSFFSEPPEMAAYAYGMIVSLPFLLATLLVYIITWENKIQQNCQLAYVFSLMCAYFFLIYIQLNSGLETVPCTILASLCFYFFMASFCWMNISCIDMYCTFSGMKGYNTFKRSSQWRRFTLYFLYAYGAPTLLLIIIFILNQGEDQSAWYHPRFSIGQCWLGHGYAVLLFFNGPMGFLLLANIILFLLTAMKIYQINKDTKVLRSRESQKHYDSNKQQFKIYVKLLLAMGINWIMEFISWLVDWVLGAKRVPEIWYITDFCNALYGVFIFILFVCKSTVWIKIKQKYYSWLGKPNMARALSARASTQNQMSMTYETTMT